MNLKEQAINAFHLQQVKIAEEKLIEDERKRADQAAKDAPVLKQMLMSVLGIGADPDSGVITLDGLRFGIHRTTTNRRGGRSWGSNVLGEDRDNLHEYQLSYIPTCGGCGDMLEGPPCIINNVAQLGGALETYSRTKCSSCLTQEFAQIKSLGQASLEDATFELSRFDTFFVDGQNPEALAVATSAVAHSLISLVHTLREREYQVTE